MTRSLWIDDIRQILVSAVVVVLLALGLAWAIPGARAAEPRTGEDLKINQSHGGSGKQVRRRGGPPASDYLSLYRMVI